VAGGASAGTLASGSAVAKAIAAAGLYFKLLVWPYPHHPFIAKVPDAAPLLMLSAVALIGVLIGWGFALLRGRRLVVMAIGLMLATLGPALLVNVLRVAATPAAERYVYLPSAGFVMLAGWAAGWAWERLPAGAIRIAAVGLAVALIGLWGWQSRERNRVWHDLPAFWKAAVDSAPETGFPYRELATQYYFRRRYSEAEPLYKKAIELNEKTLGPENLLLSESLNGLAAIYYNEKKFDQAEPLYRRALAIKEKRLGENHPDVAQTLNNLATLYNSQRRFAKAIPLYERSLAIREKALGPNHPDLAKSLNNLAGLYYSQGLYAKAQPLFERALAIRKRAFRPDHPSIAFSLGNLAAVHSAQGHYEQAASLYKEALRIYEKISKPGDPDFNHTLKAYARVLRKSKRNEEAAAIEARLKKGSGE
jgi:tetratricopeptide (TPR) repeat protein